MRPNIVTNVEIVKSRTSPSGKLVSMKAQRKMKVAAVLVALVVQVERQGC